MTTAYLADTAKQAGLRTRHLRMHEIGWDAKHSAFVDLANHPIGTLFKLYPWEWLLSEAFAPNALATLPPASRLCEYGPRKDRRAWGSTLWIEPIWKMLWSNKALLAILWELNPGHELLLPAYLDGPRDLEELCVRKPFFGREGSKASPWCATAKSSKALRLQLFESGFVYIRRSRPMATAAGKIAVLGSWLIDGEPAGAWASANRKASSPTNTSCFVPHLFS